LLQGSTLPWVIGKLKVEGDDPDQMREQYADMIREISEAGSEELDRLAAEQDLNQGMIERVRRDSFIRDEGERPPEDDLDRDRRQYIDLRLAVLQAERERMLHHRRVGTFSAEVIDKTQRILDLEEARLQQVSDESR
jgi:CPA1 family monovalent cation:H+ antiporter